jgi:hypothetical protein
MLGVTHVGFVIPFRANFHQKQLIHSSVSGNVFAEKFTIGMAKHENITVLIDGQTSTRCDFIITLGTHLSKPI